MRTMKAMMSRMLDKTCAMTSAVVGTVKEDMNEEDERDKYIMNNNNSADMKGEEHGSNTEAIREDKKEEIVDSFDKYNYDTHGFDGEGNETGPVMRALLVMKNTT